MQNITLKSYAECMDEISSNRLYEGLLAYGLFSEKLPPIFSSEKFYEYCEKISQPFAGVEHDFIIFESTRNTNTIREIGIPNPMGYQCLCAALRDNWDDIRIHLKNQTLHQNYKISRIHIRIDNNTNKLLKIDYDDLFQAPQRGRKAIFAMSSENWRVDGTPQVDLRIGSQYRVKADISSCFPSTYTHALPWAILGKETAKLQRKKGWYNDLDFRCRNIKNGETHGLLIGPHSSNLLSEIILTVVDKKLYDDGFKFTRHIDDYTCYVESIAKAHEFIQKLSKFLRYFGFTLNNKKTQVEELPLSNEEDWVNQLNSFSLNSSSGITTYKHVSRYIDLSIKLFYKNEKNSAIFNYAFKVISGGNLSINAEKYTVKTAIHLALKYTYLIPILEEYVFKKYSTVTNTLIENFSNRLFYIAFESGNHESLCYSIYFSLIYNFHLKEFDVQDITQNIKFKKIFESDNCISKLMLYFYCKKYHNHSTVKTYITNHAQSLSSNEMDKNWLFIYEVLSSGNLQGEWKPLKQAKVSFIHPEFIKAIS